MNSIRNKLCNFTYLAPTEDVFDLPCRREDLNNISAVFSYWKPTALELECLNEGGTVRLGVYCEPIPPVSLDVIFTEDDLETAAPEIISKWG